MWPESYADSVPESRPRFRSSRRGPAANALMWQALASTGRTSPGGGLRRGQLAIPR